MTVTHVFWSVLWTSNGSQKRLFFPLNMKEDMIQRKTIPPRAFSEVNHERELWVRNCFHLRLFFSSLGNQFNFYYRLLYSWLIGALISSCAYFSRSFILSFLQYLLLFYLSLLSDKDWRVLSFPLICAGILENGRFFFHPLAWKQFYVFGCLVYSSGCALSGASDYWPEVHVL